MIIVMKCFGDCYEKIIGIPAGASECGLICF